LGGENRSDGNREGGQGERDHAGNMALLQIGCEGEDVVSLAPPITREVRNIGNTRVELVEFELK
jgi:hypothetical protein